MKNFLSSMGGVAAAMALLAAGSKAKAQDSSSVEAPQRQAAGVAPSWEAIDLPAALGLSAGGLLDQFKAGKCLKWDAALKAATPDRRAMLMAAAYDFLQTRGVYDLALIQELTAHPVAGMGERFRGDFAKAPAYATGLWSAGAYLRMQPQPVLASAVTHIPDAGLTARLRAEFPSMSITDRYVFAGALQGTDNLCMVPDLIEAGDEARPLDQAKFPGFWQFFRETASSLFFQARQDPTQQGAVQAMRERLETMGDKAKFLLDEDAEGIQTGKTRFITVSVSPDRKWLILDERTRFDDGSVYHALALTAADDPEGKRAACLFSKPWGYEINWVPGEARFFIKRYFDSASVSVQAFEPGDNGYCTVAKPVAEACGDSGVLSVQLSKTGGKILEPSW